MPLLSEFAALHFIGQYSDHFTAGGHGAPAGTPIGPRRAVDKAHCAASIPLPSAAASLREAGSLP